MLITFSSLFRDSLNFIRNHFTTIFLALFLLTGFNQWIIWMLSANTEAVMFTIEKLSKIIAISAPDNVFQLVAQNMSTQDQQNFWIYLCQYYLLKTISLAVLLALIWQLANGSVFDLKSLFYKGLKLLPSLFLFLLLGTVYFSLLFMISFLVGSFGNILLSTGSLFYAVIANIFLSYSVNKNFSGVFNGIKQAFKLLSKCYGLIFPIIALWLIIQFVLNFLLFSVTTTHFLLMALQTILGFGLDFFLFTYLYRLFLLQDKQKDFLN